MKNPIAILALMAIIGCEAPQRNCQDYKNGQFTYSATINGEEKTTIFKRNEGLEIAIFEGVTDSSSVKWINDCEYILKNLNPKTKADQTPIGIKILTTNSKGYTFEYGAVGDAKKIRGTALILP